MKKRWPLLQGCMAALAMAILILDSRTALSGAQKGVELCLRTVVPALLPFFFLSNLLTGAVTGRALPLSAPLCRLFSIPRGSESLLLAGFLGGYPVGAQCTAQALRHGQLSPEEARRMVVLCNHCGPAFLFGMAAALFDQWYAPWLLWLFQILGTLVLARLLPRQSASLRPIAVRHKAPMAAFRDALNAIAAVCGWVILFRVVLAFLDGWFLWMLPLDIQVAISGALEVSNGCLELRRIATPGLRFVLCAAMVSFGGVCVTLQTAAVTGGVDKSLYFPGKVFQCGFCTAMAWLVQAVVFPPEARWTAPLPLLCAMGTFTVTTGIVLRKMQNKSSIPGAIGV